MSDKERLQLEQECLLKYSKAKMIEKYIDEFEENQKLSELWCKSQEENKQLKSILTDLEEWCNDGIKDELVKIDYGTEIIGKPIKIHIASYEMVLDEIQKLKEKYK